LLSSSKAREYFESRKVEGALDRPDVGLVETPEQLDVLSVAAPSVRRWQNVVTFPLISMSCLDEREQATLVIFRDWLGEYQKADLKQWPHLFNAVGTFERVYKTGVVVVVEGAFDCFVWDEKVPVIAAVTSRVSHAQARWISRYAKVAILALDNDESGVGGVPKSEENLKRAGLVTVVFRYPGKDPGELIHRSDFSTWVANLEKEVETWQRMVCG